MNCSCPKCAAIAEIDHSPIKEKGTKIRCPECKRCFWLYMESFAGRALRKASGIYCSRCGSQLDHSIACPACRTLYPDFICVLASKKVRKRDSAQRIRFSFEKWYPTPFSQRQKTISLSQKPPVASQRSGEKSGKFIKVTAILAVFAALATTVSIFFYQYKAEEQYSANYIRALYGIKSGKDLSRSMCDKISTDLKMRMNSGQGLFIRVSSEDQSKLNKVKSEVDKLMQKVDQPPKKFVESREKLERIYGIYANLNSLTLAPPASLQTFANSTDKLESEFAKSVQDLKANMPELLSDKLKVAQTRSRVLRDL